LSLGSAFRYPVNAIFSAQGAVRIVRELFLHGGPLSVRELVARTGLTRKSVYVVIDSLQSLGVVRRVGSAYTGLYEAADDHPLSPMLSDLFSAENARVRDAYAEIRRAAEEVSPAPMAVWLYGSVARGEDTAASDFDLAVCADDNEVEDAADALREVLRPVGEHLRLRFSVVGLSPRDVVGLAADQDPFWTGLARDAHAMYGPEPEDVLRAHQRGDG
jgi:predicted nucleotidyltransferase